jgi:hypothetical protein
VVGVVVVSGVVVELSETAKDDDAVGWVGQAERGQAGATSVGSPLTPKMNVLSGRRNA